MSSPVCFGNDPLLDYVAAIAANRGHHSYTLDTSPSDAGDVFACEVDGEAHEILSQSYLINPRLEGLSTAYINAYVYHFIYDSSLFKIRRRVVQDLGLRMAWGL